jgi:four helix bundle protein
MNISEGSLEEVKYYLLLTKDLEYAKEECFVEEVNDVGQLLSGYMNAIKS